MAAAVGDERSWGLLLERLKEPDETPARRLAMVASQRAVYADRIQALDDLAAEVLTEHPDLTGEWPGPHPRSAFRDA